MQKGTIASLKQGFGFIAVEGEDKQLFFHHTEVSGVSFDDLKEGDEVQFEVGEGQKGPMATGVQRAA